MKQIWKGKLKLRLKKECPWYSTGGREREKVFFYKFGWSLSLWTEYKGKLELSDWAKKRIQKIFPGCKIEGSKVRYHCNIYYLDEMKWLFNTKYDFKPTKNLTVMFDKKSQKYIGYSHRATQGFGIGDMLFDKHAKIDKHFYYSQKKYRWRFIKRLLKYHFKNDSWGFQDLCEDEIIGHGIMSIVPFRERGMKRIETLEEAYQAASNFADYVS